MARPEENIRKVKEEIKGFNNEAAELVVALQDVAKAMSENAKAASTFTSEAASTFKEDGKAAVSLAKELQGYTVRQLKDKKAQELFTRKIQKAESERARIQSRMNVLEQKLVSAKGAEARLINEAIKGLKAQDDTIEEILKTAGKLEGKLEDINKKSGFFDNLSEAVNGIPILGNVFNEFGQAADAAREAAAEGGDAMAAGAEKLGGAIVKAMKAFTFTTLRKGLLAADERSVSLQRNLNLTEEAARLTVRSFNRMSEGIKGITGAELEGALTDISDAFGVTANMSKETALNLATSTKLLGISAEEAGQLAKFSAATGQEVEDVTNSLIGEVKIRNHINKSSIRYQDVLKEVAGTSDSIKLSVQGTGKNLVDAAFNAKLLGLSLNQTDNIAGNLLNFEESIAAEMEAELLTGKQLNLEKARQAALDGDLEKVASEIAKNMGSAAEFGKMNRIQQEAVAKAVGMTRDELASSLAEREAIRKFGVNNKQQLDEQLQAELDKIEALKKQGKFAEARLAREELGKKLGNDELIRQRENRTLAETQAESMAKMAQAADAFLAILTPIKAAFDKISEISRNIMKFFTAFSLRVRGVSGAFNKIKTTIQSILKPFKKVSDLATKVGESLGIKASGGAGAGGAVDDIAKAAGGSAGSAAGGAAAGSGGVFSKVGNTFKKLNPVKLLTEKLAPLFGKQALGSTLSKLAGRIPILSTFIEGIFANQDIKGMIKDGASLADINQAIGKRVAEGIGGVIGGIGGASLIQALNIAPGLGVALTPVAAIAGDWAGRKLGGFIAEQVGAEALGDIVRNTFYKEETAASGLMDTAEDFIYRPGQKPLKFRKDDLIIGGTALGGGDPKGLELLERLVNAVERGGTITLDGQKVGEAMMLGSYQLQ